MASKVRGHSLPGDHEVCPVGDGDGGEDGLCPGVVVVVVRPDGGDGQTEHVVQLLTVGAAHCGHLEHSTWSRIPTKLQMLERSVFGKS